MKFRLVLGLIVLAASLVYAAYAVWLWIRGRRPRSRWTSGAPLSRAGHVSFAVFFVCIAAAAAANSALPALVGLVAWAVGYWAQYSDTKRYRQGLAAQRAENALKHPELLVEPPISVEANEVPIRPFFRVFNNVTGALLGEVNREQLQFLIRWHDQHELCIDGVKNDFYILTEMVEQFAHDGADAKLVELLRTATAGTHDVVLRWTL